MTNLSSHHLVRLTLATGALLISEAASVRADPGVACSDWAESVAVDVFQRTWVGGTAADNRVLEWDGGHAHFGDFAVARLQPNGGADRSFADLGSFILDEGDFDSVTDVALTWDGVVAAGSTADRDGYKRGSSDVVVFKLSERGELERAFASGGVLRLDLGGSESAVTVAPGWFGDLFVAGTTERKEGSEGYVLRLDRFGRLDRGFGDRGIVRLGGVAGLTRAFGMQPVPGGVLVGGQGLRDGKAHALVVRLDLRGALSRAFGEGGIASVLIGDGAGREGAAFFTAFGSSAVTLAAPPVDGHTRVATVLFDRRGRLLPAADGAPFLLDAPSGTQDAPSAGAFFWGRTLYLAGTTYPDDFATGDAFVARASLNGVIDPSFGNGVNTQHFDLEYAAFNDVAITSRSLTAAGWDFGEEPDTLPPSDALIVRYRHDGRLDAGFGTNGVVKLDFLHGQALCGPLVHVE